jgi:chaperonin cofactor prefoldin
MLSTLVEEIQVLANRMEAGLRDIRDYDYDLNEHRKIKREIKQMEWQKGDLTAEVEDLELVKEKQHDLEWLTTRIRQLNKEFRKLKTEKNHMEEENDNSAKDIDLIFKGGGIFA